MEPLKSKNLQSPTINKNMLTPTIQLIRASKNSCIEKVDLQNQLQILQKLS